MFCPRYYREKQVAAQIIANVKSGHHRKDDALYYWNTYGQTYYHELMHFPKLVNETKYTGSMPDLWQVSQLKALAADKGCKGGQFVGDDESFWASSMYARKSFRISTPPGSPQ